MGPPARHRPERGNLILLTRMQGESDIEESKLILLTTLTSSPNVQRIRKMEGSGGCKREGNDIVLMDS